MSGLSAAPSDAWLLGCHGFDEDRPRLLKFPAFRRATSYVKAGVVLAMTVFMSLTAQARKPFPINEAPTERTPRNPDGTFSILTHRQMPTERPRPASGTRRKVDPQGPEEIARMAMFASRYASMRDELDSVLDPKRVPIVSRTFSDLEQLDSKARWMLRFVNGVSTVADIVARSGVDRTNAVAILCKLAADRAIVIV